MDSDTQCDDFSPNPSSRAKAAFKKIAVPQYYHRIHTRTRSFFVSAPLRAEEGQDREDHGQRAGSWGRQREKDGGLLQAHEKCGCRGQGERGEDQATRKAHQEGKACRGGWPHWVRMPENLLYGVARFGMQYTIFPWTLFILL